MTLMRGGRWSTESGSIYRALRRLEVDELLVAVREPSYARARKEYALTAAGEATLKEWLTNTPDRQDFAFLPDPIRSRAYFLSRLTQREQMRTVEVWLRSSRDLLREFAAPPEESCFEKDLKELAQSNLHHLALARHAWLEMLRRRLAAIAQHSASQSNNRLRSSAEWYRRH
jgi:DNA-binding PadR family transcriptional regulator